MADLPHAQSAQRHSGGWLWSNKAGAIPCKGPADVWKARCMEALAPETGSASHDSIQGLRHKLREQPGRSWCPI